MRHFISGRQVCALVLALSAATFASSANAAFLTVVGGPTYSQSSGGYMASNLSIDVFLEGLSNPAYLAPGYADVNDAGVAFAGVFKMAVPLTSTLADIRQVGVRWSATQSPVELGGPSADSFQPRAINQSGAIVGSRLSGIVLKKSLSGQSLGGVSYTASAAAWPTPGDYRQLDPASTPVSRALDINSQNIAVGTVALDLGIPRAAHWSGDGTFMSLGAVSNYAIAINSAGSSVGINDGKPTRWDASGNATELGGLIVPVDGRVEGYANSINDAGAVAGFVRKFDSTGASLGSRAVRWDAGSNTAVELGDFGDPPNGHANAAAIKINASGAVIGNLEKGNTIRGVRWDAGSTTPVLLQSFAANTSSVVWDLNASGIAVGQATGKLSVSLGTFVYDFGGSAVYWGADGTPVDLNSLIDPTSGWFLKAATGISDTGWITGVGSYDPDGAGGQAAYDRPFLLQVPEPSAIVLGTFGVLAASFRLRRRMATDLS